MSTQDARLGRLLQISHPRRSPKIVGVTPERTEAPLLKSSVEVVAAMSRLTALTDEVHNSALLPSEKANRLSVLQPAAVAAARAHLQTIATERARIAELAARTSAVPRPNEVSFYVMTQDSLFAQRLAAMGISAMTTTVAKAIADPVAHQGLVGALLRLDADLLGVPATMLDQLRAAALPALRPEEAAHLQALAEQLEFAERTASLVEVTLAEELPGATAELRAPLPQPKLTAAERDAANRETVLAELPPHVRADLLRNGRHPIDAELRNAAGGAGQA